jgi:hypothetical protein
MILLNMVTAEGNALGLKTEKGIINLTALSPKVENFLLHPAFFRKAWLP